MPEQYTPDPFKNFTPRQNPPQPAVIAHNEAETIDPATLAALNPMTKEELIALIRRVSGAMWGIAIQTQQEREDAMLLNLSILALTSDSAKAVVATTKEYFDRMRGKPAQTIDMTVKEKGVDGLTTDRLIALEKQLAQLSGCDALIIPPMPKPLGNDSV